MAVVRTKFEAESAKKELRFLKRRNRAAPTSEKRARKGAIRIAQVLAKISRLTDPRLNTEMVIEEVITEQGYRLRRIEVRFYPDNQGTIVHWETEVNISSLESEEDTRLAVNRWLGRTERKDIQCMEVRVIQYGDPVQRRSERMNLKEAMTVVHEVRSEEPQGAKLTGSQGPLSRYMGWRALMEFENDEEIRGAAVDTLRWVFEMATKHMVDTIQLIGWGRDEMAIRIVVDGKLKELKEQMLNARTAAVDAWFRERYLRDTGIGANEHFNTRIRREDMGYPLWSTEQGREDLTEVRLQLNAENEMVFMQAFYGEEEKKG